jgi:hypothetical protein
MNYFIRDCNNDIVGNNKGYKTLKGANRQADIVDSKVFKQIYDAYDNRTNKANNLLLTVKQDNRKLEIYNV